MDLNRLGISQDLVDKVASVASQEPSLSTIIEKNTKVGKVGRRLNGEGRPDVIDVDPDTVRPTSHNESKHLDLDKLRKHAAKDNAEVKRTWAKINPRKYGPRSDRMRNEANHAHGDVYDPSEAMGTKIAKLGAIKKMMTKGKHSRGADTEKGEFQPIRQKDSLKHEPPGFREGIEIINIDPMNGTYDVMFGEDLYTDLSSDQLDELSKKTLKSYVGKAKKWRSGPDNRVKVSDDASDANRDKARDKAYNRASQRHMGIQRAVDKLDPDADIKRARRRFMDDRPEPKTRGIKRNMKGFSWGMQDRVRAQMKKEDLDLSERLKSHGPTQIEFEDEVAETVEHLNEMYGGDMSIGCNDGMARAMVYLTRACDELNMEAGQATGLYKDKALGKKIERVHDQIFDIGSATRGLYKSQIAARRNWMKSRKD